MDLHSLYLSSPNAFSSLKRLKPGLYPAKLKKKKPVNDGNGKVIYFQISIAMIALVKIPQIPFYMHPVHLFLTYK